MTPIIFTIIASATFDNEANEHESWIVIVIRAAVASDRNAMCALLPRLAGFEIPSRRRAIDLWRHDEQALLAWLDGREPDGFAHVAVDGDEIVGMVFTRLGKELLSEEPSAHLEAVAVADGSQGRGIATRLIGASEQEAKSRGALTMTLHVFAANTRARSLYEKLNYDGELIRFIKDLDSES